MKKRLSVRKARVAVRRIRSRSEGLIGSPLVKGLIALIPVLLLTGAAGLAIWPDGDGFRSGKHEAGKFPRSPLAHWDLAVAAALSGDYALAEKEYLAGKNLVSDDSPILGTATEIEEVVWPEIRIENEIEGLENKEGKLVSRAWLLALAINYWRIGEDAVARAMFEEARRIDPNDPRIEQVRAVLER